MQGNNYLKSMNQKNLKFELSLALIISVRFGWNPLKGEEGIKKIELINWNNFTESSEPENVERMHNLSLPLISSMRLTGIGSRV